MRLNEIITEDEESTNDHLKKDHSDDLEIVDPSASYALNKARTEYGHAGSDLEAFILATQDRDNEQDHNIKFNTDVNDTQETEINNIENELEQDTDIAALKAQITDIKRAIGLAENKKITQQIAEATTAVLNSMSKIIRNPKIRNKQRRLSESWSKIANNPTKFRGQSKVKVSKKLQEVVNLAKRHKLKIQ